MLRHVLIDYCISEFDVGIGIRAELLESINKTLIFNFFFFCIALYYSIMPIFLHYPKFKKKNKNIVDWCFITYVSIDLMYSFMDSYSCAKFSGTNRSKS